MILVVFAGVGGWLLIVMCVAVALHRKPAVEVLSVTHRRTMERAEPGDSEDALLSHLYAEHADAWCGLSINASMKSFRQAHKRAHITEGTPLHSCGRIEIARDPG